MLDCKHIVDPWSLELVAKNLGGLTANVPVIEPQPLTVALATRCDQEGVGGLSVQTHTVSFAHLSAGRLTQEVRRMSKHVRPRQNPPSLHKDRNSRPAKEQPQPQERQRRSSLRRRLEAFHSGANSRKEMPRSPTVGQAGPEVQGVW